MTAFKLVISDPKTGLSVQREAKDAAAAKLIGLKTGDKVKGELIDLTGYELEITGGSDYCGFPMRKDVVGAGRKRILAVEGVGVKKIGKGIKQRKTVCGNTIHAKISQINMKVTKEGSDKIFEAKATEKSEKDKAKAAEKEKKKQEARLPAKEKPAPEKKEESKKELKEKAAKEKPEPAPEKEKEKAKKEPKAPEKKEAKEDKN